MFSVPLSRALGQQFARGLQRLSDKVQSNRTYGQFIAFFAVCVVKISAVSSIVSIDFCVAIAAVMAIFFDCHCTAFRFVGTTNIFSLFFLWPKYEFYTEKNCFSNVTFESGSLANGVQSYTLMDDCDYNVAMNVSRFHDRTKQKCHDKIDFKWRKYFSLSRSTCTHSLLGWKYADIFAVDIAVDDELCGASDIENRIENNSVDFVVWHLFHGRNTAGSAIAHIRSISVSYLMRYDVVLAPI